MRAGKMQRRLRVSSPARISRTHFSMERRHKGHVTTRYYGWYANRPRGMRRHAEAARRWAALLQQIFEVDPLRCPTCHGAMRIVAFIT